MDAVLRRDRIRRIADACDIHVGPAAEECQHGLERCVIAGVAGTEQAENNHLPYRSGLHWGGLLGGAPPKSVMGSAHRLDSPSSLSDLTPWGGPDRMRARLDRSSRILPR